MSSLIWKPHQRMFAVSEFSDASEPFVTVCDRPLISSLIFLFTATHSEKTLLQKFIQPTMELVEEAWRGEATTTKRHRGTE